LGADITGRLQSSGTITAGAGLTVSDGGLTVVSGVNAGSGWGINSNAFTTPLGITAVDMTIFNGKTLSIAGSSSTLTFSSAETGVVDIIVTSTLSGDLKISCDSNMLFGGLMDVSTNSASQGVSVTTAEITTPSAGSWFRVLVDGTNCYVTGVSIGVATFST
jgi:hypothetical protein